MATSLFKMPFDIDKTRIHQIYRSETLDRAGVETISCDEMKEIYGELKFDKLYEDRPYTYTSLVTSIDGRIMKEDYYLTGPVHDISEVTGEMIEAMKANRDKILVIATGDKAPDSKVALYIMKKFGLDKVLVETPSYMHYLVSQKMMDELFFNYSCIYVGGQALTIGKYGQEFGSKDHPHTRMLSIHSHSDHFFYFRHKLIYG